VTKGWKSLPFPPLLFFKDTALLDKCGFNVIIDPHGSLIYFAKGGKKMDVGHYEMHENCFDELPIILRRSIFRRTSSSIGAPLHFNWHESIEIIYVDDGDGVIICDFEEHQVSRGDIFIINSDVLHSIRTDSQMSIYYLIVDSTFCKGNGLNVTGILFESRIKDSWAISMYGAIIRTVTEKGNFYNAKVRAKVLDFVVYLCEKYSEISTRERLHDKNFDNIRTAIIYIRDHIREKITVDGLALISGMSKYHFIREFKRITHYTPVMYINIVRIEMARRLISEKDMSIGEVSELCGFDNLSYFTKTFKKYTGMTPSEMRLEKRQKEKSAT
jgi:AraC-like DNA-binding protein/mannose-6-phosphate isomerase-like protein (cupin superfamily)